MNDIGCAQMTKQTTANSPDAQKMDLAIQACSGFGQIIGATPAEIWTANRNSVRNSAVSIARPYPPPLAKGESGAHEIPGLNLLVRLEGANANGAVLAGCGSSRRSVPRCSRRLMAT